MQIDLNGQTVSINNEGQKVIYQLRRNYLEGSLAASNDLPPEVQAMLNKPITIKPKLYKADPADQQFLEEIISKVDNGQIKLFTPSTLLNNSVYEALSPELKAKVDYDILILIHKIRQIKKLWDEGDKKSYQILNLVHSMRLAKESLESLQGDVFII